jgi:Na+(H+)/acetate symporter ActP
MPIFFYAIYSGYLYQFISVAARHGKLATPEIVPIFVMGIFFKRQNKVPAWAGAFFWKPQRYHSAKNQTIV